MSPLIITLISLIPIVLLYIWQVQKLNKKYPELQWKWQDIDIDATLQEDFPSDFLWGSSTAAHQVEGNNTNNNWHQWEQSSNKDGTPHIHNGEVSGDACQHFTRYREDLLAMKNDLGMRSYRFSIEWSRIEPQEGTWDEEAIAHYTEMIDFMLDNDIEPMITLHHFTSPIWFEQLGTFEKQENISYFVRFAEKIFNLYSDRVKLWCTLNECESFATMGWFVGLFPPGKKNAQLMAEVLCNMMRAHCQVYNLLKGLPNGQSCQIGLVKSMFQFDPWQRWNIFHWLLAIPMNKLFNDSILNMHNTGRFTIRIPFFINVDEEIEGAKNTGDFIGLNYYSNLLVCYRRLLQPLLDMARPGQILTDFSYTIYPEGFYRAIDDVAKIGKPIYITENGIPDKRDDRRATWIRGYLYAMKRKMNEGVNIKGFYYWTLMDNFEWAQGYNQKFGLYEVDRTTQKRTLRQGTKPLVDVIKRHNKRISS